MGLQEDECLIPTRRELVLVSGAIVGQELGKQKNSGSLGVAAGDGASLIRKDLAPRCQGQGPPCLISGECSQNSSDLCGGNSEMVFPGWHVES